ncbi:MAG: serine hydrolase domain-containing protein [Acidobacteriota bacterium]
MRLLSTLAIAVCLSVPGGAQAPSSELEAGLRASIDQVFARFQAPGSPGCTLGVYRDGRILHKAAYGMANLDHDVPLTTSSVFHVASVSKQFTAAAVALLALEGKLSLDDEVRKHVPELPDFGHRITLRHLVHHTSGFRDQWSLLGLAGWRYSQDLITDDDVLEMMARQRDLNFPPGERHVYCNTGYTLLATVAARVSGVSFRTFTTERIFAPLGMTSTHFRDDHAEIVKGQAYGYVPAGSMFRLSVTNFDTVGATSLLTTVEDLAHWDGNFVAKTVGGDELANLLIQPGVLNGGETLDYAFGLVHGRYKGLRTLGHGGSDAGYRSQFLRFPDQRVTVACLCNLSTSNPGELVRQVADVVLAEAMPATAATDGDGERGAAGAPGTAAAPQEPLESYAGLYWNPLEESARRFVLDRGKLYGLFGQDRRELKPVGGHRFLLLGSGPRIEARFERVTGEPTRLALLPDGGVADQLESADPFVPTREQLDEFAGSYRSDEMDAVFRMVVEKEALVLKRLKVKPAVLEPTVRDAFQGQPGSIRFTRSVEGRVSGFVLHAGRVRGLRFWKDTGSR